MTDFIKVKATNTEGRVALWERSTAHPTGEVFVTGDGSVVEVANTVAVRNAIKAGELVEVQPEQAKAPVKTTLVMDGKDSVVLENDPTTAPLSYVEVSPVSAAIRQEGSKTTKR
jgi:hypothetical protein